MNYYTYAYLREDGTPYYIGKGLGRRWKDPHRVAVPPAERVLFLKTGLTEAQAFAHEVYLIAVLGRKDLGTGCLQNLTDGGEGVSGRLCAAATRDKIRQTLTGVKHTEERRRAMSEARMGKEPWNKGRKGHQKNHVMPPTQKGKKWFHNPLTNESKMCYDKPNPNWIPGRGSLPHKGRKGRRKNHVMPPSQKGKKWWNNPLTGESRMCYDKPNINWIPGRGALPRKG